MSKFGQAMTGTGGAAANFSRNLASITERSWKSAADMMRSMRDIDWDKGSQFMSSFGDFLKQFGVFSELIKPFMMLVDVFDAALIKEFSDEIVALNKWCAGFIDDIQYWTSREHVIDFTIKIHERETRGHYAAAGEEKPWYEYIWNPAPGGWQYAASVGGGGGGRRGPKTPAEIIIDIIKEYLP